MEVTPSIEPPALLFQAAMMLDMPIYATLDALLYFKLF